MKAISRGQTCFRSNATSGAFKASVLDVRFGMRSLLRACLRPTRSIAGSDSQRKTSTSILAIWTQARVDRRLRAREILWSRWHAGV